MVSVPGMNQECLAWCKIYTFFSQHWLLQIFWIIIRLFFRYDLKPTTSRFHLERTDRPYQQNDVKFMDDFLLPSHYPDADQRVFSAVLERTQSGSGVTSDPSYDRDRTSRQIYFSEVYGSGQMASTGSSSDCSSGFQFNQRREEGYDFDFVLPREEKYDCPICLLVLRDPYQTECGHRFCQNCIKRWLRLVWCKDDYVEYWLICIYTHKLIGYSIHVHIFVIGLRPILAKYLRSNTSICLRNSVYIFMHMAVKC